MERKGGMSGKMFEVSHRYRSKPKISTGLRKCCKWQSNSQYNRQSCKRVFINHWMLVL